jgi:hypothetical protein
MDHPERNGVAAVFLPAQPEATVCAAVEQAAGYLKPGLRLYTNGRQLAVLPAMLPGWSAFMERG